MKKMQCEVCGSTEIKKIDDTTFGCQSCGVQYSKEELQKLLVEITGAVQIDRSSEVNRIMKNAKRLYETGDYEKAYDQFCDVLNIEPQNCNALLYTGLSWVRQSKSNKTNADKANHYFKDAINTKHEQVGDTAEFYDYTGFALQEILNSLKSAYNFIIKGTEKSILKDLNVDNIGESALVQMNNRAFAKKKFNLAVNGWNDYFCDIYEQLLDTLKKLYLSNYEAGNDLFFTEYVNLMETRYFNVFVGKTELIAKDKETVEQFGIKKELPVVQKFSEKLNNPAGTNSGINASDQKIGNSLNAQQKFGSIFFTVLSFIPGIGIMFSILNIILTCTLLSKKHKGSIKLDEEVVKAFKITASISAATILLNIIVLFIIFNL